MSSLRRSSALILSSIAVLALAGCEWPGSSSGDSSSSSSASSIETRSVKYEGILQKAGIESAVGGTHFLALDAGGLVAIQSYTLALDAFIDARVSIDGEESVTSEGYPVVAVTNVEVLQQAIPDIGAASSSSEQSSSSEMSSISSLASSSTAPAPVARSSSSKAAASSVASSIPAQASMSSSASSVDAAAVSSVRAATMAKAQVSDSTFTQKYCSAHMGYCVPVHKNWYYTSFGATTNVLWHLEVGPDAIENIGDGIITVDLVSSPIEGDDGAVVVQGQTAAGFRAWTGGKHFVVRGPASLKAAIEFMTKGITTL